jgi:hypothetical protein
MNKGDSVLHIPTQQYFVVSRKTKARDGSYTLWDGQTPYPAAECVPDDREVALDEVALASMQAVVAVMIESGDYSDLELLSTITKQQKGQLWLALTQEQRDALKAAGQGFEPVDATPIDPAEFAELKRLFWDGLGDDLRAAWSKPKQEVAA